MYELQEKTALAWAVSMFQLFCSCCIINDSGAVRAAGSIVSDSFAAERALADFLGRSLREEVIHLLDDEENNECNYQEVNDGINEFAISDDRNAKFLCFCYGGNRNRAQRDEEIGEINLRR